MWGECKCNYFLFVFAFSRQIYSNIINTIINISPSIFLSVFIIIEFGPPMSLF